jgi:hypothetical protein
VSHLRPSRRGHRRLIAEGRHEDLPAEHPAYRSHVKLRRGRVCREVQQWTLWRRQLVVIRQSEAPRRTTRRGYCS